MSVAEGQTAQTKAQTREHRCPECQQNFSRAEHLRRHLLRHSDTKSHTCMFCSQGFSRSDKLRDHYNHCRLRGDRQVPDPGLKGRRRHACEACASTKSRCTGGNPCTSCIKKGSSCLPSSGSQHPPTGTARSDEDAQFPIDRVSIQALLNMGTDTFTEAFNLPPCEDRSHSLELHRQISMRTAGMLDPIIQQTDQHWSRTPQFPFCAAELDGSLEDFWTDPFRLGQQPALFESSWESQGSFSTALSTSVVQDLGASTARANEADNGKSLTRQAALLNSALQNKLWCLQLEESTREELSACLNFLLTPNRLARFVSMYFEHWHPNSPVLHRATFDLATVPTTLLASVVFLGAMYTIDHLERLVTRRLLDVVELVVFDSDTFSHDFEVSRSIQAGQLSHDVDHWMTLRHLQAGYIMVVIQYWAGSRASKHRAMETRFGEVIKVARRMKLTQIRQLPSDRTSEVKWLQKESGIRTMVMLTLLDSAFQFYSNYPSRLELRELKNDLPCKGCLFETEHPFMQDDLRFSRHMTTYDAFTLLFADKFNATKVLTSPIASSDDPNGGSKNPRPASLSTDCNFTVLDLFLLIHLLFVFMQKQIMALGTLDALRRGTIVAAGSQTGPQSNSRAGPPVANIFKDAATTSATETALSRWRLLWQAVYYETPLQTWNAAGMFKNGINFWLLARLLMSRDEAVEVMMGMELKCEDALSKFKVLLQGESEQTSSG